MTLDSHYNKLYTHQNPFGENAEPIVKNILKYKSSGTVLDLGAGQGRSSLFLAKAGFDVTAIDLSEAGIEKFKKQAAEGKLKITAEIGDARKLNKDKIYDVILLIFLLHHLSNSEAQALIKQVRSQTSAGGLNVIATFTKNGDFYKNNPDTNRFYPNEGELKEMYSDLEILEWEEKITKAFQKTPEGKSMFNMTSFLIARKTLAK